MAELNLMEKIISLAKRRGFVFPGSEIYGGLAGTFDYGPLGVVLKENVERLWLQMFRDSRDDMHGVDAAILMNPKIWEASGHVSGFSDPLVECGKCKKRFRADHLVASNQDYNTVINEWARRVNLISEKIQQTPLITLKDIESQYEPIMVMIDADTTTTPEQKTAFNEIYIKSLDKALINNTERLSVLNTAIDIIGELQQSQKYTGLVLQDYLNRFVSCPECKSVEKWAAPTPFNMMFKTHAGANEDTSAVVYLRPETAGGIFMNFKNVVDSLHPKLPFGIAQIGKAFRNEIAPRDFIFRLRELSQMEIEYFVHPSSWEQAFEEWRKMMHLFAEVIGLPKNAVHELEVSTEDRAHYSKRTIDFEFDYPFGRKELWGLAYRTDFDLSAHANASGTELTYLDEETKEKFIPHVIEPSLGVDRTILAILSSAYREDDMGGEVRTYLALAPKIAPVKAMVSPLLKNKPELVAKAREVRAELKRIHPAIAWDDNGNIGKRYRRQDEIGTPFCITIDFDTLGETPELKDTVTLRHRDTGTQERLTILEVAERIRSSIQ